MHNIAELAVFGSKRKMFKCNKKALFVGLTGVDYVYYLDSFPKENSKCKTNDYSKYVGGPAANAAITYSLLGGDATLITALGDSVDSRCIEEELTGYGVKVINVAKDKMLPGISTICISEDGKRTIISGQKSFEKITIEDIQWEKYDFALFDCNQQDISLPILDRLECDIVLDAGSYKANVDRFLRKAKIVISSEHFKDENDNDIFDLNYPNIEYKAITRGEKSIIMHDEEILVPAVECIDSLAAGDIFHGAFCYAFYEQRKAFRKALVFASEIASESVKYRGPRVWHKHYNVID